MRRHINKLINIRSLLPPLPGHGWARVKSYFLGFSELMGNLTHGITTFKTPKYFKILTQGIIGQEKCISVLLTTASFRCIVNQVDETLWFCVWPVVITHPITIPYTLATQRMGHGPTALASTRSMLQTQNLGWGHSRPLKSELIVSPAHQAICRNIKD